MTRPLDRHLDGDEIEALISSSASGVPSSGQLSEQAMGEARHHVDSCKDCERKMEMHRSVHSAISQKSANRHVPPGSACRADAEWVQVAAGLLPEAETRDLMKHASQCAHCGPLLKAAAETLGDDVTPEEEALLARLENANPKWQSRMARILKATGAPVLKQQKASWLGGLFGWPRLGPVAGAVAVLVVGAWLGVRVLRPPSADQLLAQAYTERRTFEVRIPGAKYAPIHVERGASGSNLDKPESLLKAEALISESLRKHPDDPTWLEAKARADVLDGNFDSAIKTLQRAMESQPDSPQMLRDLGIAYFLRGKSADQPIDYGNAIESLGKALAKTPDDPIALFDRALACEQMFLYTRAVDDWEHYLRVDSTSEWATEARQRVDALKEKLRNHEKGLFRPLLTPKQLSTALVSHPEALSVVDDRAEGYLGLALKSWLPEFLSSRHRSLARTGDDTQALDYLAQVLNNNHDDAWLFEFLQHSGSSTSEEAVQDLVASDDDLNSGRYGRGLKLAQRSVLNFQRSANHAGALRANFEVMLAEALTLNYQGCLDTAARMLPSLTQNRYRWLRAATLIEQGQCFGGAARLQEAIVSNRQGLELTKRYHYPELGLRAAAFGAGYSLETDASAAALSELIRGLERAWQLDTPGKPGENLYSVLSDFADSNHWPHVEAYALTEILVLFPTNNQLDQAIELEFVAGAEEQAGDYTAAQTNLRSAAALLSALPDDSGVVLRRGEATLATAVIELHLGDPNGAIASLSPLRHQFETASAGQFQAEYFKTMGDAYLALGQFQEAQDLLAHSLIVAETGLGTLTQEADKLSWTRLTGQVYRDLLEVKLKLATPAEAFAWWEWYKGASILHRAAASLDDLSSLAPALAPTGTPSTVRIAYALLSHSVVAFVLDAGNVRVHELPLPENLEALARLFLAHCSDSSADGSLLDTESSHLYKILVAPLESDILGKTVLQIETDGSLDLIPFNLLHGTDGIYLGDRFEMTFSPGMAYGDRSSAGMRSVGLSSSSPAVIVVAAEARDSSLAWLPEATEEGQEVASHFNDATVISGPAVTRAEVMHSLRNAQIFHFAGHATATVKRIGLALGSGEMLSARDLSTSHFSHLKLAVLSGCDTANGADGTIADVNSLARTLAAQGIPEIVASRWTVDSGATRQLMRAFYSNLMSGKTAAESLRDASIAIRALPQYRHPYYWGSFSVFSNS